ncbi:hypothetical protein O6P43_023572 [Quillaja saponaria]|uniref:Uncharacterized protein n=1 Tax=Quillaja saponaria TaxID=32244 RepID=A0AAD7LG46_QUISA|nr:hypothetical protein O6P43_023572 [Quillaja saponaria]
MFLSMDVGRYFVKSRKTRCGISQKVVSEPRLVHEQEVLVDGVYCYCLSIHYCSCIWLLFRYTVFIHKGYCLVGMEPQVSV